MLPAWRESNPQPPDHHLDVHPTVPPRPAVATEMIIFLPIAYREIKGQSQDVCIQCIVDLLKDLQNDGTAGEFLIYMLQVHAKYLLYWEKQA